MTENDLKSPVDRSSAMHLLRVLLVYLGASFAALEAVDLLGEKLGLPEWVFTGALVLLLIGLPMVVATALIQARAPRATELASADETSSDGRAMSLSTLLTWRHALLGGVFAFALLGVTVTGWFVFASGSGDAPEDVDPNLVAVLPFRTAGADASLAYLGDGMVDLMAALLTGEGGLRALDPRTTLAAVRRHAGGGNELVEADAIEVARSLGAGQVMLGSVVGSRDALTVAVTLKWVEGAQTASTQAQGPADSLHALLDRLTGELLASRAGVSGERMTALSPSLEAIRAYLDGRTAYRSGRFEAAARHLERAVEIDSSFVLAASGAISALVWFEAFDSPRLVRAAELAWKGRDRLPPGDRLLTTEIATSLGLVPISRAAMVDLLEESVSAIPDQPEAWYFLGDSYSHWGDRLGVEDPNERARADLERAYALDSTFVVPLIHLLELAAIRRDTSARQLLERYVAFDSTSYRSTMDRLLVGTAINDADLVDDAYRTAADVGDPNFRWAAVFALQSGIAAHHVDSIHALSERFVRTDAERVNAALQRGTSLAIQGRPEQAAEVLARAGDDADRLLILHALYSDLDDEVVRDAVEREVARAAAAPGETLGERRRQGETVCAVGQWKLWHGLAALDEIEWLRAATQRLDARGYPEADPTCLELLEAISAVNDGWQDAQRLVESLDSVLLTGPSGQREEYNLAASYLLEEVSLPDRALAAARRRSYDWDAAWFVATYLRQEGRLAELTGDREGAIAAYSHYLKLREDPEPQLAAQRDSVRAALARLTGEP
jgi:tetratricopeptide (TPR) repeat protein